MQSKIVVSTNCQTAGLAAALRALFPSHMVKPVPMPDAQNVAASEGLVEELKNASIWVTRGRVELAEGLSLKILRVPAIYFAAFHPDLCYATTQSTKQSTKFPYNSRIAVWAYNRGLSCKDAARLFSERVFQALGYLTYWERSVQGLKEGFLQGDLTVDEFQRFYLRIKRSGLFMHSVNHPSAVVLVELAKIIAARLGISPKDLQREVVIADSLTESIWPLYPAIGNSYSLPGCYSWRMFNQEVTGLDTYIEYTYRQYEAQRIAPGDLRPQTQVANIDSILESELARV